MQTSTSFKLKLLKDFKTGTSNISDKVHTNSNKTTKRQSHFCLRDRFSQCHICEENKNINRNQNVIDCKIEPLCNSCQPSFRERRPAKSLHYQRIKLCEEPQKKKSSNLLNGFFDEEASSRSFQEALKSWRTEKKNTQSLQTETLSSNQVADHKVFVNTSTSTHNVSPDVPLTVNFSEKSSLLYHERLLLFNRYMTNCPSSPAEESSSDTPSQEFLNNISSETKTFNRIATNDDEKENFVLDEESVYYSPLIDVDLYRKSVGQQKSIDECDENEKSVGLPYSKTSCATQQIRLFEIVQNEDKSSETKDSEPGNFQVIFPKEYNNMQARRQNQPNHSVNGLRPPIITSQEFGENSSARQRTNILPLPPLSPRVITSPQSNLSRPMTEITPLFSENSIMKKKDSLLPLYSQRMYGPRTPLPPSPKPPWSIKRGGIPPLDATNSFLAVKSPSGSRSPSPLFRRSLLSRSPLPGFRSQKQFSENRSSVDYSLNSTNAESKELTETTLYVPNEMAEENLTSASNKTTESSPCIPIISNNLGMDFFDGVIMKDPIVPNKRGPTEKMLTPTGLKLGPNLWNPDDSIVPEIADESPVNYEDFGIKDYLNSVNSTLDEDSLDSLSISGDFNSGLDADPPDVLCTGGDLTILEEELGLPSPERTESPILIMAEGKPVAEELLDVKKIQEEIIMKTKLCSDSDLSNSSCSFKNVSFDNSDRDQYDIYALDSLKNELELLDQKSTVTNHLVRLSSVELEQMDQKQVDAALSIEEDNGQGSGLSSPVSELENEINPTENGNKATEYIQTMSEF